MSGQAFDEAAEEWLIWSVFERSGYRFASRKRDQTKAGAFSSEVGSGSRQENATKQKLERFQAKWAAVRVKKTRPNKRIRA
ncbi:MULTISPECIES: hypothetical protein [Bradyrhizobium]|uniref:hypothetical protein n=1 Tax=Bradyrhizobium elkanii TaxID=29448 RepID=UPI002714A0BB|nr:hypothetical protein [Bradyrhizobium elkanii]WLA50581.1 hypothetical protein QIH80_10625 [Bradyrhizobium elkanii]WLB79187.1 hypothetical protein QIH83_33375 [Bradyrhizobium elkanii]